MRQRLQECPARERKVLQLRLQPDIPVHVVLEDEGRGKILIDDADKTC